MSLVWHRTLLVLLALPARQLLWRKWNDVSIARRDAGVYWQQGKSGKERQKWWRSRVRRQKSSWRRKREEATLRILIGMKTVVRRVNKRWCEEKDLNKSWIQKGDFLQYWYWDTRLQKSNWNKSFILCCN